MISVQNTNLKKFPAPTCSSKLRRKQRLIVHSWFLAFIFLSLISWFHQQLDFEGSLELGIPIPDIVNISHTFDNIFSTDELNQDINQFWGVSALYGWTWLIHPSLCFAVNLILISWATKAYSNYFIKKIGAPAWSIVGLLGNPYVVLAMAGPNKEIPLILLTLLYFRAITERGSGWILIAGVISLMTFLFRDGYGAFLAFFLLLIILFNFRAKLLAVFVFIGCLIISSLFGLLESVVPILQRNIEGLESFSGETLAVGTFAALLGLDPLSVIGGSVMFLIRAAYNLLTLSVFPIFQTTGGVYWLGISYWIFGVTILISIICCIVVLLSATIRRSPLLIAAALTIGTWFMISLSLFVQPRYLMPVLPLAVAVMACCSSRIRQYSMQCTLVFIGLIIFSYWSLDRKPPLTDPDSFNKPAYVFLA